MGPVEGITKVERDGGRLVFTLELQEPQDSEDEDAEQSSPSPWRGGSLATSAPLVGARAPSLDPTTPLDAKRLPGKEHRARIVVFGSFT